VLGDVPGMCWPVDALRLVRASRRLSMVRRRALFLILAALL